MSLDVRILSGSPQRGDFTFSGDSMTLGRDPSCGLAFDAERDLEVSAQHAALVCRAGLWYVRDLGSRNGTYLDGEAVVGDRLLADGAIIRLGAGGPELRIGVGSDDGTAPSPRRRRIGQTDGDEKPPRAPGALVVAAIVTALFLGLVALLIADRAGDRVAWENERLELIRIVDSVVATTDASATSLRGTAAALGDSLARATTTIRQLQAEIRTPAVEGGERADGVRIQALEERLMSATAALTRYRLAASVDWEAITAEVGPAVAQIFVEGSDGAIEVGSGFLVRHDGLFVTVAHLVGGDGGRPALRRIAIQMSGSAALWDAALVFSSAEEDLALIRLAAADDLARSPLPLDTRAVVATGQPVAVVGFPLGGEPVARGPEPVSTIGIVAVSEAVRLEIQGYSERGGSGSPVVDARGSVIGVLRGGSGSGVDRMLVAVPALRIRHLLGAAPAAAISPSGR